MEIFNGRSLIDFTVLSYDVDAVISHLRKARLQLVAIDVPALREKAILIGKCINEIQSTIDNFIEVNNHE